MDNNIGETGLLQRIDQLLDELQSIRREVADLLLREADRHAQEQEKGHSEPRANGAEITCISSLEELYAHDFTKEEETPAEPTPQPSTQVEEERPSESAPQAPTLEAEETPTATAQVEPSTLDLNDLFIPSQVPEMMEGAFEPKLTFHLHNNLTIADKYLFANELFMGNQDELSDLLTDIERLSSWSQLESYLYDVRRFNKEEEPVKQLVEFIKENSH